MRIVRLILLILLINLNFSYANENLFDSPIELIYKKDCSLDSFCKQFVDDVDIEKFIKREMEYDYVVVSLDECLDVAMKNNFNVQISDKEYFSYRYEYQNALAKFLPTLGTTSYISGYQGQFLVDNILSDSFNETALSFNLTVRHDLTQGGKTIFEARAAKYFAKSKKHDLNFTRTEVLYLTTRYYFEMLLAKINIEIFLRNLIERNAQFALTKNLATSGFGTQFDVVRAQNLSAYARVELLNALNQFRLSQSRLANIMGIDVQTPLMPFENEINPMNLVDADTDTKDLFKIAIENREDIMSYKDLISYQKQVKNSYYTDFMPKPLVDYQYQLQGTLSTTISPNYNITLAMIWKPGEYLGVGTATKIKAQKEKIKKTALELENKLREIEQLIVDAKSTSIFSQREMLINKSRLDYSRQGIKLALLRFDNGKGILLDVIQAQSEATQARVQYASSIIRYNIAQVELLYNIGTITSQKIIDNYNP